MFIFLVVVNIFENIEDYLYFIRLEMWGYFLWR